MEKLLRNVEKELHNIAEKGLNSSNLEMTYKLIDIYKDIKESCYYETAKESMERGGGSMENYGRNYSGHMGYDDDYGRRYVIDEFNRSGYNGYNGYDARGGNSGRSGGSGRYSHLGPMGRHMERLEDEVDNYNASRGRYRNGGSQERLHEGIEMVMETIYKFVEGLMDYAETPKEKEIIRKYAEKIKNV